MQTSRAAKQPNPISRHQLFVLHIRLTKRSLRRTFKNKINSIFKSCKQNGKTLHETRGENRAIPLNKHTSTPSYFSIFVKVLSCRKHVFMIIVSVREMT